MAACGTRAASRAHAADWRVDGLSRERLGRTGLLRRIPRWTSEARVDGRPQHPARHALGVARRCGGETAVREGTRRATTRSHSFVCYTHHGCAVAANAHHPNRFRDGLRSRRERLRREPGAAGRKRHRLPGYARFAWWQVVGATQEIAPRVARVAMLFNPAVAPYAESFLNPFKAAAPSFAVEPMAASVGDTSELESVIAAQARAQNGGLIVMPDTFTDVHRAEIISLAAR